MNLFRRSLPFAVVVAAGFAVFEAACLAEIRHILWAELREKSEAAAAGVGHPLNEAFAMGEYDRIQRALEGLKQADADVDYAVGIEVGSQVIASTDPLLRNRVLTRNEFEASAWQMTDIGIRENTDKPKVFEVVVPVKFRSAQMGVLRIGVSWERLDRTIHKVAFTLTWISLALIVLCSGACGWVVSRAEAHAS